MTHDEELQRKIEQGDFSSLPTDTIEVKAYQEVFKALDKAPVYTLPADFASKVVTRLETRQKKSGSLDFIWFAAGVVLLFISLAVTLRYITVTLNLGFLKNLSPYKSIFIFGVSFIILLNWIDHRFIRNKSAT